MELRTCEGLWAADVEDLVWEFAGDQQFGRSDSMMATYVSEETSRIRAELGLPDGSLHTDNVDAFFTVTREADFLKLQSVPAYPQMPS